VSVSPISTNVQPSSIEDSMNLYPCSLSHSSSFVKKIQLRCWRRCGSTISVSVVAGFGSSVAANCRGSRARCNSSGLPTRPRIDLPSGPLPLRARAGRQRAVSGALAGRTSLCSRHRLQDAISSIARELGGAHVGLRPSGRERVTRVPDARRHRIMPVRSHRIL
jgi:hypothetical protein